LIKTNRSYFVDNLRDDVVKAAQESLPPKLAQEMISDYDVETLDEAGGLLYSAYKSSPKKVGFKRNSFKDLGISDQIRVLKDNVDNYNSLIKSINTPEQKLLNKLQQHNPNKDVYDDLIKILSTAVDSKTGIYGGPGQVGSPNRKYTIKNSDGSNTIIKGKQFSRDEAIRNAAQFLTESEIDRLLGTHVSFPQQGHVLDAKNNIDLARDPNNMRAQQAAPNWRDGADAKGLVNLSREDNLTIGRDNDVQQLLELIDERMGQEISGTETMNLLNMAKEIQGKQRFAAAPEVKEILENLSAGRDAQAAGAVVGEKPTVINAGEGSRVYVEGSNGNGSKAEKIKAILKNGNGNGTY